MQRWRIAFVIVLVAMALRVPFAISMLHQPGVSWRWGGESFSIANAVVSGHGFSSPYFEETGPTAQQTPGFPYFLAVLYYIGGGSMDFAFRAILGLNVVFSALTCVVLIAIGNRLRPGHGNLFGWAWAVLPILGFSEVVFIWATALYTFISTLLIWLLMKIVDVGRITNFFWWGILAGASLLLDPAYTLVLGLILSTLWLMGHVSLRQFAIATCAIALILGPWIIRNNVEVGYPTSIRSNLGFEVYRGLVTDPWKMENVNKLNPGRNPTELALYKELGEHRYMAEQNRLAKDLVINNPSLVLRRVAIGIIAYWAGNQEIEWRIGYAVVPFLKHMLFAIPALTGLWGMFLLLRQSKDRVAAVIFVTIILVFPLPYYATIAGPRYRVPIEPFLVLLTVYGFLGIRRDMRRNAVVRESTATLSKS
jgi:hypothetical protein